MEEGRTPREQAPGAHTSRCVNALRCAPRTLRIAGCTTSALRNAPRGGSRRLVCKLMRFSPLLDLLSPHKQPIPCHKRRHAGRA